MRLTFINRARVISRDIYFVNSPLRRGDTAGIAGRYSFCTIFIKVERPSRGLILSHLISSHLTGRK